MGRPLAKRFFGNRNFGSASTAADDGLGGSSVASVTIDTPGSYTSATTVTFAAPDLAGPGAVTATGSIVYEALSATVSGTMVGYSVGDLLTVTTAGGSAIAYVATIGGTGGDDVLTVNFTGTGASRGSFTSLAAGAQATTTADGGTGCELTVTYRVKSITITEPGSGYTDAADAAVTFGAGAAAGTSVMTADTTAITGRQEAAIVAYAYVTGGSNKIGDIVKQVGTRRYKVETADGSMVCSLVTDGVANAAGEMTITATDVEGNTYYVSKLTRHKATLVQIAGGSDYVYATNGVAPWSFDAASGVVVQIANK